MKIVSRDITCSTIDGGAQPEIRIVLEGPIEVGFLPYIDGMIANNKEVRLIDDCTKRKFLASEDDIYKYINANYIYANKKLQSGKLIDTPNGAIGVFPKPQIKFKKYIPPIKKVIFGGNVTTVLWDDGTKTNVRCMDEDSFTKEGGVMACITKKYFNNSQFSKKMSKLIDDSTDSDAKKAEKEERKNLSKTFRNIFSLGGKK